MKIFDTRKTGSVALSFLAALTVTSFSAFGHASFEQETADSDSTYRGVMVINHGCSGSPTTVVRIRIPEGVKRVKPLPKAGWELTTVVEELDEPYEYYDSTITEEVRELMWSGGSLSDDFFDEFVFRARLPEVSEETTLYFPTVQECENGEFHRWIEIPDPGKTDDDYDKPAPALKVLPVTEE